MNPQIKMWGLWRPVWHPKFFYCFIGSWQVAVFFPCWLSLPSQRRGVLGLQWWTPERIPWGSLRELRKEHRRENTKDARGDKKSVDRVSDEAKVIIVLLERLTLTDEHLSFPPDMNSAASFLLVSCRFICFIICIDFCLFYVLHFWLFAAFWSAVAVFKRGAEIKSTSTQ